MSKLSKSYPMGDISKLNFSNPWQSEIDPIFAGRLVAADITEILSGYRSNDEQEKLVKEAVRDNQGYYESGGGAYNSKGQCMVAPPGTSWHNYKVAVDVVTDWAKGLSNGYLKKFGLFKPMNYEPWHIQPIETATEGDKQSYLDACVIKPLDYDEALMFLSVRSGINYDYWIGRKAIDPYFEALIIKIATTIKGVK